MPRCLGMGATSLSTKLVTYYDTCPKGSQVQSDNTGMTQARARDVLALRVPPLKSLARPGPPCPAPPPPSALLLPPRGGF